MIAREKETWEAISSVLNGTGTEEQYLLFNAWIAESDENKKTFELLSKVRRVKDEPSETDKKDVYERVHTGIRKSGNQTFIRWLKYGNIASVFIILSLSVVLLWPKSRVTGINIETRCPLGTKSKVTLSDGTIVHLNAGSVLEYPPIFNSELREVKLRGEAFFEVTHERKREFVVNTGKISIKVFGTRFNVKNYEIDKSIETTLVEGSVGVFMADDPDMKQVMFLKPNEQAIYEKSSGKLYSKNRDAEMVSIWKDGKYYFEDETLETIVLKLEREFNQPLVIASEELRKEIFTGMFDKNKTIYHMLDLMKRKRGFTYKEVNDTIIISKQ